MALENLNNQSMEVIKNIDNEKSFFQDILIDRSLIEKENFDISEKTNFKNKNNHFAKIFRKNNIFYGIMMGEVSIPIDEAAGTVALSLVNKEQINERLKKIKDSKIKSSIKYININTIQIIIKGLFRESIDTSMDLELIDDRINDDQDKIIASGACNLKFRKVKFDVTLQTTLSLLDSDLDKSMLVNYDFKRIDLFKEGNHPFSISYKINYALSNSSHSVSYNANSEGIHIDNLFSPIIKLEKPNQAIKIKETRD